MKWRGHIYQIQVLLLCGLGILFSACEEGKEEYPEGLLDPNTFTAVMVDMQLAEAMKGQFGRDKFLKSGNMDLVYQEIYSRHKIDEESFKRTFAYYHERPAKMEGIFEQVLDSLNKMDARVKQEFAESHRSQRDSLREAKEQEKKEKQAKYLPSEEKDMVPPQRKEGE